MLIIREAKKTDSSQIVAIHFSAFQDFFLTSLGGKFLKLYYESVRDHQDGILLVSELNGNVIGFCAGTLLSSGFNIRLIKSKMISYGMAALILLFSKPNSILHLFRNMIKEEPSEGDDGNYSELLSIGVDPHVQRIGVGKALLQNLEIEVKKRGSKRLSLTTDYSDNDGALSFYKSLGYELWYDFTTYPKRRMYRLIKEL